MPVSEADAADTTVWCALPPEGGRQVWEGLRAATQPDGSFLLCAVPLFAYDLNFGDQVAAIASAEGPLVATDVLADGGQSTFRVALHEGGTTLPEVVETFGAMGCLIEGWSDALLGLGCDTTRAREIANRLALEERAEHLAYETGRQRTT
ncbi:DUF4265 domain-containing protein [Nocardioides panacisoli]|uniref:DUF4265 domain-containing protein n=1 Tax=Nocardioides panacisoli TaxID=627624 RepID=UPI001C63133A|nr:DUF4265 domain-containing protein [Nocardioides panacisoli]QYJ02871.1 DUF4265 domain-containing protein [Nocardioides panacisoli]